MRRAAGVVLTVPPGGDRHSANTRDAQPVAPVPIAGIRAEHDPDADATVVSFDLPPLAWAHLALSR